jgi:hypothetical protein
MANPSSLRHVMRRRCSGVNVRSMKCIRSPCLDRELRKVIRVDYGATMATEMTVNENKIRIVQESSICMRTGVTRNTGLVLSAL